MAISRRLSVLAAVAAAPLVGALSPYLDAASASRRAVLSAAVAAGGAALYAPLPASAAEGEGSVVSTDAAPAPPKRKFQRYPQIRFIAALGDKSSSSGDGCGGWGLWRDDPGPRGVYLRDYADRIVKKGGVTPAGWKFDGDDYWVEEHGLIMSNPVDLPRTSLDKSAGGWTLPYKRYVVTGDREITTVLTVRDDGGWELEKGTLYDVTHLPCRSARYTPATGSSGGANMCSPEALDSKSFPVRPGAAMPPAPGCNKVDYAVLFVLGEEV